MTTSTSNFHISTSTINDVQGKYKPAKTYTPRVNNRTDGVIIPRRNRIYAGPCFRNFQVDANSKTKTIAVSYCQREVDEITARLKFNRAQLR